MTFNPRKRDRPSNFRRLFAHTKRDTIRHHHHHERAVSKTSRPDLRPGGLLLDLPVEILLEICDRLETEYQVLLGLCCKQLYRLLRPRVDFGFWTVPFSTVLHTMQYLEIDHPQYLTCRMCGRMFHWRDQRRRGYQCPIASCYLGTDNRIGDTQAYPNLGVSVRREVIDLVLRAYRWGPSHGLPPTVLDVSKRRASYRASHQTRARFVDGRLLLVSHFQVVSGSSHEVDKLKELRHCLCLHHGFTMGQAIGQAIVPYFSNQVLYDELSLPKCDLCATDARLYVSRMPGNRLKVELKVWRCYGTGEVGDEMAGQMFDSQATIAIDDDTLSQRDLQADFETARVNFREQSLP